MKFLKNIFLHIFCLLSINCFAQSDYQMKPNEKYTEIDFLSSYYNQDGNNAAVTGGIGTEALTDIASMIVVNIPLDSTKSINFSGGADYYTSASTDNIDNNKSSASSKDIRAYANLGFSKKNLSKARTWGFRLGYSGEYDYTSINGGFNFAKEFNGGNTELSLSTQVFIDQWETYYPRELRGDVSVPTKSRNSFNGQITLSQVINKKIQFSISAEAIYMDGLLSTPFHRVYFSDQVQHDIERLPNTRLKLPLAARLNVALSDRFTLRTYYRYYYDDFGIAGHTANIEIPIKLNDSFTISPFYRYHTQTASDYFAPFESHSASQQFYSSDYDLSDLNSNKTGIGMSYTPLYGIGRLKIPFTKKIYLLNGIQLRASSYKRSTGLNAFSISLALNMRI